MLGCGSKLLVSDENLEGAILKLSRNFNSIEINGNELWAEAGALLSEVSNTAFNAGLSGFEMTSGVPATLGGAIAMNFGAFGSEIKDILKRVKVADSRGEILWLDNSEIGFRYRGSKILDSNCIILEAIFILKKEDKKIISQRVKDNLEWRKNKQPSKPSFGSVFKNTKAGPAGLLIDKAGLKGHVIGRAQIWDKHANFIINLGNATFKDVYQLIELCRREVKKRFDEDLELEVRIVD